MRTFFSLSGGRVEVRTRAALRCGDCGTEYHPRVHAHAGAVVALAAATILGLLALLGLVVAGWVERSWVLWAKVGAAVVVAVLGSMALRLQKSLLEPKFYSRASGREPAYGEIVLECPRCGSAAVAA